MYFQKIKNLDGSVRENCVACIECGRTIKTKTRNTTNLLSHLKIKHPNKYADVKKKAEEKKQIAKRPLEIALDYLEDDSKAESKAIETSSSRHTTGYKMITEKIKMAGVLIRDFQL